ncbi:unnamed protein product [Sphagnum tenellum]
MENDLRRWIRVVETEQIARRFIIKPAPGVGKHTVFENGEAIATIWFERTRWRNEIKTKGKLTLLDGRSIDLGGYSTFADVKRHLSDLITNADVYAVQVTYDVSLFRYARKDDGWELSFTAATKTKNYGFTPSGTGNAWTVFGTVIDIARKFITLKHPKVIKIESDITERSRVAVNRRIARAIANGLPYEIEDEEYHIFIRRMPEELSS